MNSTLLYINNQLVDLSPDTAIATTLQMMQVGDLTKRNVSYTNQIRLPFTPNNDRIFEFAKSVHSKTRAPYNFTTIKIVQDGIEIANGWLGILESVKGGYNLTMYDSTKGFIDAIKNKYVDEIDLGVYTRFLFFSASRDGVTPGAPVIDYGRTLVPEVQMDNNTFNADQFTPWENDTDGLGVDWEEVTGSKIGATLSSTAPGNETKRLIAPFRFYKGFRYRILLSVNVTSGSTTGNLTLKASLPDVDETSFGLDISTTGFKTLDDTFVASSDFTQIEITASQNTSGTSKTIALNYIMIYPVHEINLRQPYQLPVLGYKDILTKIVEDAGYTWDNQLDTVDANYLDRLAITFSKRSIRYSQRFREQYEFSASPDGTQVINADSTHKQVLFPVTNKSGAAGWWNSGASTFETEALPHNLGLRLFVNIVVEVSGYTSGNILFTLHDGSFPYFYPDTTVIIGTTINANGVHTVAFRMDTRVIGDNAEDFMVTVVAPNGTTIEVLSGSFYAEIEEKPVGVWQMSNIVLPDMLQKDFFVDFLRRFGMLFYQNGTTIVTRPLKRLINDREDAPDWTAKRDASFEDEISFVHGQYAQSNIFSDSGADELEKGRLIVDGDQLEAEREIYTSRFVTPDYIIVDGVRIVRVPVFGFDSDDRLTVSEDFQEGVRLVYLRDAMDGDPAVEYEGTPTNDHFVAVYDDPRSEKRADWQFFLDNYYEEFRRCLNEAKVVRRRYFLDVLDVQGLNLTKPVYDSGAYYMVEKVENYVPGQSTKVTLFKIS